MKVKTAVLTLLFVATAALFPNEYVVDKAHSSVGFTIAHMMISKVSGRFTQFEGTISYDPENIKKWAVSGSIDAASINTDIEKRDNHLRSPDFFDVKKYPKITFTAKQFKKQGKGYVGTGTFTMHGVTKEIEIPFTIAGPVKSPWGKKVIAIEAGLTLNRKDFGLNWNKALEAGGFLVGDVVTITLYAEAVEK